MEVQESVIHKSSRIRNLKCDICKKMYASKDVLRKHIKSVHFKDGFVCTKCNVKFDQKRKLDFHMQQHNNESMFSEQDSSVYIQGWVVNIIIAFINFTNIVCPCMEMYVFEFENITVLRWGASRKLASGFTVHQRLCNVIMKTKWSEFTYLFCQVKHFFF